MIDQLAYGVKEKKKKKETSGRTSDSIFLSVRAAFQQLCEDEYFCRPAGTCLILFQARSFLLSYSVSGSVTIASFHLIIHIG